MKPTLLQRHPSTSSSVPTPWVRVARAGEILRMTFRIPGDTSMVRLPSPNDALVKQSEDRRANRLWEQTCFECFVLPGGGCAYLEFNFSPSLEWAAYEFDNYRENMRDADVVCPAIIATAWSNRFELSAQVSLPETWNDQAWRVGLAAVIQEKSGNKSYWALAHPATKPDFHHPDSFVHELP